MIGDAVCIGEANSQMIYQFWEWILENAWPMIIAYQIEEINIQNRQGN
jgi:hypothetical protein